MPWLHQLTGLLLCPQKQRHLQCWCVFLCCCRVVALRRASSHCCWCVCRWWGRQWWGHQWWGPKRDSESVAVLVRQQGQPGNAAAHVGCQGLGVAQLHLAAATAQLVSFLPVPQEAFTGAWEQNKAGL